MFLSKDEFENLFEANYRAQKIGLYPAMGFSLSSAEISRILPVELSSYLDEGDGLGFRHCWYGIANNQLFVLTNLQDDSIRLRFVEKQENEKYQWTFLKSLTDLPKLMLQRIVWIRSASFLKHTYQYEAKSSIFHKNSDGIVDEVYRAKSLAEAEELLSFLQRLHSEINYWIDESEDLSNVWTISRILPGDEEKIVGRYTSRSMTEDSARFMSLRDSAIYKVKEEKTDRRGLMFVGGSIINSAE